MPNNGGSTSNDNNETPDWLNSPFWQPGQPTTPEVPKPSKPWYRKKRYAIPGAFLALSLVGSFLPDDSATATKTSASQDSSTNVEPSREPSREPSLTPQQVAAEKAAADKAAADKAAADKAAAEKARAEQVAAEKAAAAAAKKEAAEKAAREKPVALSAREFQKLVKEPDAYTGRFFIIFGEVTQFDAATGDSMFLARSGPTRKPIEYGYVDYKENTAYEGDTSLLDDVVEGDVFRATVEVLASISYDTQIGGNTTVRKFRLTSIEVSGSTA